MVVEIMVIGIQFGGALLLLAIGLLGYGVVLKPLSIFPGGSGRWLPLFFIGFVAASYSLGILVDRFAMVVSHVLFRPLIRQLPFKPLVQSAVARERTLMEVFRQEQTLGSHLMDIRSRQRITRATAFNIVLVCLAFLLTPYLKTLLPKSPISLLTVVIFCLIVLVVSFAAWTVLELTYEEKLRQTQEILSQRK